MQRVKTNILENVFAIENVDFIRARHNDEGNETIDYKLSASFAKKLASENLSKLDIKQYIDERLKEIEDKRINDGREVLQYFTKVILNWINGIRIINKIMRRK
ncbi:hypothetical protein EXM65_14345 [Clostridium botulinum]|uniref:Uncharacterized protein n=1 Tax=Clostridium botulinum TaxID=1491 RepID=A0A6M0SRZ9_CLOBO|nr:hypothetical protein [Clostridium botulinum]